MLATNSRAWGSGVSLCSSALNSLNSHNSQDSLLGTPFGRFLVIDHSDDSTLGRWDSYADADAHVGEHVAMDPEADLEIYDLAVTPC